MDKAGQALMLVGIALLLHGAVSSAHYKSLVASRYGSSGDTPLDVTVEVLGGALAVVLGAVLSGPAFVPIYGSVQSSPLQSVHALFTPRADLAPARGAPPRAVKGGDTQTDLD
jgi:hypothetical protein